MNDPTPQPVGTPPASLGGLPPLAAIRPMVEVFMAQFAEMNERIVWIQKALSALNKKLDER